MKSWSNKGTFSPTGNSEFIVLAEIVKEWGVQGKIKALPLSKKFSILKSGDFVHLILVDKREAHLALESITNLGKHTIMTFAGITTRNDAISLRSSLILIEKKKVPLDPGEYYYDQIIGISVVDEKGHHLGVVDDIFETGSNDVYVIKNSHKEFLLPAITDVIAEIDILHKQLIIRPFHGMFD